MTLRTPDQFRAVHAASREALQAAVLQLFARHGFESSTVRLSGVDPFPHEAAHDRTGTHLRALLSTLGEGGA